MARELSQIAQEKKWQRQNDARTLAEATEIKKDKGRLSGAIKESKIMVTEEVKRLSAMKQVSRIKPSSKKK
jgi:hypothetical protein